MSLGRKGSSAVDLHNIANTDAMRSCATLNLALNRQEVIHEALRQAKHGAGNTKRTADHEVLTFPGPFSEYAARAACRRPARVLRSEIKGHPERTLQPAVGHRQIKKPNQLHPLLIENIIYFEVVKGMFFR